MRFALVFESLNSQISMHNSRFSCIILAIRCGVEAEKVHTRAVLMSKEVDISPSMDWLKGLETDMSVEVLTCLDDPKDLVHVSSVSRTWRHIVVENGLCKRLCMRNFPQLSRVAQVVEVHDSDAKQCTNVGSSKSKEWDILEREYRLYAFLANACASFPVSDCISGAVSASSTDNYPEESIDNTLYPRRRVGGRASYWSSKGQKNPAVPEMLTYKLKSDLVLVTEIKIHPFQAYFQPGSPIYSAAGVRFHMGHAKVPIDVESEKVKESCNDDNFEWTYSSQVFPMAQDDRLQTFKLPEPVICMGGILQVELVGRVQRQEMDDQFYICVTYVEVKGISLGPAFSVEANGPSGFVLKRHTKFNQPSLPRVETDAISNLDPERLVMHVLHGNAVDFEEYYEWNYETDEEEIVI